MRLPRFQTIFQVGTELLYPIVSLETQTFFGSALKDSRLVNQWSFKRRISLGHVEAFEDCSCHLYRKQRLDSTIRVHLYGRQFGLKGIGVLVDRCFVLLHITLIVPPILLSFTIYLSL